MGAKAHVKGGRVEREFVHAHRDAGVHAERFDGRRGQFGATASHDIDVYWKGKDEAPLIGEVKARKNGAGFKTIEGWLADNDALFLKRNNAEPLVVVPWRIWVEILK